MNGRPACVALLAFLVLPLAADPPGAAAAAAFPAPRVDDASGSIDVPYAATGDWFAGNTHVHTFPHAYLTVTDTAATYRDLGFSFAVITEHDAVADLSDVDGFTLISGEEISVERDGRAAHILALGADTVVPWDGRPFQDLINDTLAQGALALLGHPNFQGGSRAAPSWTAPEVLALRNVTGIELYNHITDAWSAGDPWAFQHWFALLSEGRAVWAFAVDDPHVTRDPPGIGPGLGYGYVVVQASSRAAATLLDSMGSGRLIAVVTPVPGPPAVWPSVIRAEGRVLTVGASDVRPASAIHVFDAAGRERANRTDGGPLRYTSIGDEGFLVVILEGADGSVLVLQPMRVRAASLGEGDGPADGGEDGSPAPGIVGAVVAAVFGAVAAGRRRRPG